MLGVFPEKLKSFVLIFWVLFGLNINYCAITYFPQFSKYGIQTVIAENTVGTIEWP